MRKVKMIALVLSMFLLFTLIGGCAHKGYCEACGQYEKLNKFVDTDGDVYWYCDDCYSLAKIWGPI